MRIEVVSRVCSSKGVSRHHLVWWKVKGKHQLGEPYREAFKGPLIGGCWHGESRSGWNQKSDILRTGFGFFWLMLSWSWEQIFGKLSWLPEMIATEVVGHSSIFIYSLAIIGCLYIWSFTCETAPEGRLHGLIYFHGLDWKWLLTHRNVEVRSLLGIHSQWITGVSGARGWEGNGKHEVLNMQEEKVS